LYNSSFWISQSKPRIGFAVNRRSASANNRVSMHGSRSTASLMTLGAIIANSYGVIHSVSLQDKSQAHYIRDNLPKVWFRLRCNSYCFCRSLAHAMH